MPLFSPRPPHPLAKVANNLRLDILNTVNTAGFGHIGGSLSSIDIFVALYLSGLFDFDKDHFVLSAGHLCLSHYVTLAHIGKFPKSLLSTYSELGSPLQGHESINVPGVEYSSGSLGQGLSFATGLALGHPARHTVCLTSDGEHNEGQIWEALMFARKHHLGNLINVVDYNGYQIGGSTTNIMPLDDLAAKYIRFGWTVITTDGHDYYKLINALKRSQNSTIFPACVIAKTTIGKGISFMENDYHYHDVKNLPPADYQQAQNDLKNISHQN